MIGELEAKILALLIFERRPMTTAQIKDALKITSQEAHKGLVMLRRENRVQFVGKKAGWIPA